MTRPPGDRWRVWRCDCDDCSTNFADPANCPWQVHNPDGNLHSEATTWADAMSDVPVINFRKEQAMTDQKRYKVGEMHAFIAPPPVVESLLELVAAYQHANSLGAGPGAASSVMTRELHEVAERKAAMEIHAAHSRFRRVIREASCH